MRQAGATTLIPTLSTFLIAIVVHPSMKASAFVPTLAVSRYFRLPSIPPLRAQGSSFSAGSSAVRLCAERVSGPSPSVLPYGPRGSVLGRHFTVLSMTMKDWDDNEGNKTDVYSSVGAAGNLRSPGKGFKPPVDPSPRVDRANFGVKPDTEADGVSFEERQKAANFGDLVEFPCKFQIKIVGARQGEFLEDILDSIGNVVNVDRAGLPHSVRDKGKWRSITVRVPVESAEQLYEVYAAIDKDPRVQFKF